MNFRYESKAIRNLKLLFILIIFIGCEKAKKENLENMITEAEIVGFYHGINAFGFQSTIELNFGGSFVLEGPGVGDDGIQFGTWVLSYKTLQFYVAGYKAFSAKVIDKKSIQLAGNIWRKVR